jgi:festuclavine dehydrogenase
VVLRYVLSSIVRVDTDCTCGHKDNFAVQYTDRINGKTADIASCTENGLIGYVSTEDIAEVAFKALVDDVVEKTDLIIVGPELLSYDKVRAAVYSCNSPHRIMQIAVMLTETLGREIKHTRMSQAEFEAVWIGRGLPKEYAQIMVAMDGLIAVGKEAEVYGRADVVGKRTLRAYFEANKDVWQVAE